MGVTEKGVSALESLLFAKYQMFRNVYWHHAVRAATLVFRRLIETALGAGLLEREELPGATDEELLNLLAVRQSEPVRHGDDPGTGPPIPALLAALTDRRLPKRAVELMGDALPAGIGAWMTQRPELVRRLEDLLADQWGLSRGSVLIDYPDYPEMLQLRLLLVRRGGEVRRLTSAGAVGLIDLPRLSQSLQHAARVFRVFALERVEPKDPAPLLDLLAASEEEVVERLDEERALY